MPGIPPFSRSEKISDYAKACFPIQWQEKHIKSSDGVDIALCIGKPPTTNDELSQKEQKPLRHVLTLYFQGNASSLPPRLPFLSSTLRMAQHGGRQAINLKHTIIAISYRGFWTSRGRPSQRGIEFDADSALRWVFNEYRTAEKDTRLVIWGQSIGAGVAAGAAARLLANAPPMKAPRICLIDGVILETPFTSIRDMLIALYPQKFLPYRYLWPFLWNWWDTRNALDSLASHARDTLPEVLIIQADNDEIVPLEHGKELEEICSRKKITVERRLVTGALHTEAMAKIGGRQCLTNPIFKLSKRDINFTENKFVTGQLGQSWISLGYSNL
ncbi:MAG: hypothetical protein M1834_005677 [Cirrosporium novae-zelandiae]|nr:MAG: hypothetical protein M1834_005677 [Cirrosporium novae-zelandiae]